MVPANTNPPAQSAENFPDASVAVWVVTAHWTFPQLEKSGTAEPAEPVTAEAVDVPWTTQVPSMEGVVDLAAVADVLVVGPSTLLVRSTLHAAVAASRPRAELKRRSDCFIDAMVLVSADIAAADTVSYKTVAALTFWKAMQRRALGLSSKDQGTRMNLHEACHLSSGNILDIPLSMQLSSEPVWRKFVLPVYKRHSRGDRRTGTTRLNNLRHGRSRRGVPPEQTAH
jgi:hypothetical protein